MLELLLNPSSSLLDHTPLTPLCGVGGFLTGPSQQWTPLLRLMATASPRSMADLRWLISHVSERSRMGDLEAQERLSELLCELEDRLEASGFYDRN